MSNNMSWILRAIVSGGVLLLLFAFVPLSSVGEALLGIGVAWLALAVLVNVFELVARSVRLRILTGQNGMPLSTWSIIEINLITAFYSLFLPGDLAGGAFRWYRLSRPGGKRAEAFAAIAFARLVDTIGLFALGALFIVLARPSSGVSVALCLGILAGLVVLLVLSLNRALLHRLLGLVDRLAGSARLTRAAIVRIAKVVDAVSAYRTLPAGPVVAMIGLTIARHLLSGTVLFVAMIALGVEIDWVNAVWINMLVSLAVMVPVSVAGLGVREGLLTLLLAPFGVDAAAAVALGLVLLAMRAVLALAGGLLEARNALTFGRGGAAQQAPLIETGEAARSGSAP